VARRPLAVALTGGIAAGKSTALAAFARHGAATLSADAVVHELLEADEEVRSAIRGRWGGDAVGDRDRIGAIVFDGTPLVRLRYTLARLLPLPASHGHDYSTTCGTGCGFGYFIGDHSCASSCGGVA